MTEAEPDDKMPRRREAARFHRAAAVVDQAASGWKDHDTHYHDVRSLRAIGLAVCGRNNLISSDFADVSAVEMEREFSQGVHGVRITFTVSNHALEKVSSEAVSDAINALVVPLNDPDDDDRSEDDPLSR